MNIFDQYLEKIKKIIINLSKNSNLILPDKLDGITSEAPPLKFNSDISTNVAMVLSKINKKSPTDLAVTLAEAIKKNDISRIIGQELVRLRSQTVYYILERMQEALVNLKEK